MPSLMPIRVKLRLGVLRTQINIRQNLDIVKLFVFLIGYCSVFEIKSLLKFD